MGIDLLDGDFYVSDPYPIYARLRDEDPLHRDEVNDLWGVSRYDDIVAIEKDKVTFSNVGEGRRGYRPNIPADRSIIGLDDPHHVLRRNVVSRRFTPVRWAAGKTTCAAQSPRWWTTPCPPRELMGRAPWRPSRN